MIYLRVHPDTKNYDVFDSDSWLYDTRLNDVDPSDLTSTDVIFRMTPDQFKRFKSLVPDGMFFRVYPDKTDTNLDHGTVYDEDFQEIHPRDIPQNGTFLVIPATAEEFTTFETLGRL